MDAQTSSWDGAPPRNKRYSSCTSAGECTVKETVHSEFGLEGVRSLVVNDVDPSFVPGVAGKVGAMSGQTSWDDICESARPWLNGKDPADVLPPCGSSRNTAYMLWAFSAMTAARSSGMASGSATSGVDAAGEQPTAARLASAGGAVLGGGATEDPDPDPETVEA